MHGGPGGQQYTLGELPGHAIVRRIAAAIACPVEEYDPTVLPDDDHVLGWELPHHGDEPTDENCGKTGVRGHFPDLKNTVHFRVFSQDCSAFRCPVCRSEWDPDKPAGKRWKPKGYEKREGIAIAKRFEHGLAHHDLGDHAPCNKAVVRCKPCQTKPDKECTRVVPVWPHHPRWSRQRGEQRRGLHPRGWHIVVSPPQAWAKKQLHRRSTIKALWTEFYRVASSRGVAGGVAIFHHVRVPSQWNERSACAKGPHWHVLGTTVWGDSYDGDVCKYLMNGGDVRRRAVKSRLVELRQATLDTEAVAGDGWVVKFKDDRRRNWFRTAAYQLSHASRPVVPAPEAAVRRARKALGITREDPLYPQWRAIEAKTRESGVLPRFLRYESTAGTKTPTPEERALDAGLDASHPLYESFLKACRTEWAHLGDAAGGAYPAFPRSTVGTSGVAKRTTKGLGRVPRWFGCFSYNKLAVPDEDSTSIRCPVCHEHVAVEDWHRLAWVGEGGFEPPPHGYGISSGDVWHVIEATPYWGEFGR